MKKKLLTLCLSLALCVSLVPAALAAPEGFTDVPAGSWYEEGGRTCAEKGVMVGTGEGIFSPDTALTDAECLTLAVRLYDLQYGGDGALEKAPEDWGTITLSIEGQEPITGGSERFVCAAYNYGTSNANRPNVRIALPVAEGDQDWATAQSGKTAVLTAGGASITGTVDHSYVICKGTALFFFPETDEETKVEVTAREYCQSICPSPDQWWRDTVYTAHQLGLTVYPGFSSLLEQNLSGGAIALREDFARALAEAAGELEPLYTVETLPDLDRETAPDIFKLYDAGVLTGTDEQGTFDAGGTLTRAQAAVMVARVLDPNQRVTTSPRQSDGSVSVAPRVTKYASYDEAMAHRKGFGYINEQLLESEDCTVVVNDYGGMPLPHTGVIRLFYKDGSALGGGTVLTLPHARVQQAIITYPADTMTLSEDGKALTYTYYRPEDILGIEGEVQEVAGQVTYTVDLPTGELSVAHTAEYPPAGG